MMFQELYTEVLYRPLFNGLIAAYVFLPGHDLGVAIVVLTALVRLILHPLISKQYRSQRALTDLQPQVEKIRAAVKGQQEQSRELMALYKREGVHPASGCLPLLIQLPILFSIYRVLAAGLHMEALSALYPWIPRPLELQTLAFGILDLSKPNIVLAVIAGVSQYIQARMMLPPKRPVPTTGAQDMTSMMTTQSLYVMPVITVVFALGLPAGLSLYWAATTILGILQNALLKRRYDAKRSPGG